MSPVAPVEISFGLSLPRRLRKCDWQWFVVFPSDMVRGRCAEETGLPTPLLMVLVDAEDEFCNKVWSGSLRGPRLVSVDCVA